MADSIEEVVRDYLNADATFKAKFTRIDYLESPTGTALPYINYWLVDDNGRDTVLNHLQQGEARIQFDLWCSADKNGLIKGTRLRRDIAVKVKAMSESRGGYYIVTTGITEQTIPRESGSDPFHFVVDGILRWRKE